MNDWTRILLMNNMWRSIYSIQNPDIEWLNRFTYLWFDFEKCFCICFLKRLIKQNSSLLVQVSFSRYQLPRYTYKMSQKEKKNFKKTLSIISLWPVSWSCMDACKCQKKKKERMKKPLIYDPDTSLCPDPGVYLTGIITLVVCCLFPVTLIGVFLVRIRENKKEGKTGFVPNSKLIIAKYWAYIFISNSEMYPLHSCPCLCWLGR